MGHQETDQRSNGGHLGVEKVPASPPINGIPLSPLPASSGSGDSESRATEAFTPSVAIQDLSSDSLLMPAPRESFAGKSVPALGGIPILAKLGQGGMGAVYYGVHPRLDIEVAVKVLPLHLAEQQPELVDRFMREAKIAARIKSPHLVGVSDVNQERGLFYLVMEFVYGRSAGAFLRETRKSGSTGINESVALDICIAATEGLVAAHAAGVIHRDIKPDNILIPQVRNSSDLLFVASKLADLGLARNEIGRSLTGSQNALGTPGYLAPEQAINARTAGKQADVFSMGAALYALLSGASPFHGETPLNTILATLQKAHTPLPRLCPEISVETAVLVDQCLEKEPKDRFADGSYLLTALKASRAALNKTSTVSIAEAPYKSAPPDPTPAKIEVTPPLLLRPAVTDPTLAETVNLRGSARSKQRTRVFVGALVAALAIALGAAWVLQGMGGQTLHSQDAAQTKLADAPKLEGQRAQDALRALEEQRAKEKAQAVEAERKAQEAAQKLEDERKAKETADALTSEQRRKTEEERQVREAEEKKRIDAERIAQEEAKQKLELARAAFASAVNDARNAKGRNEWQQVLELLNDPLNAPANAEHVDRKTAEALVAEARLELTKYANFSAALAEAEKLVNSNQFTEALAKFEESKRIWPDAPQIGKVDKGIAESRSGIEGLRQEAEAKARNERYGKALAEGQRRLAAGEFESAEAAFNLTLIEKPNDHTASQGLADARAKAAQAKQAAVEAARKADEERAAKEAERAGLAEEKKRADELAKAVEEVGKFLALPAEMPRDANEALASEILSVIAAYDLPKDENIPLNANFRIITNVGKTELIMQAHGMLTKLKAITIAAKKKWSLKAPAIERLSRLLANWSDAPSSSKGDPEYGTSPGELYAEAVKWAKLSTGVIRSPSYPQNIVAIAKKYQFKPEVGINKNTYLSWNVFGTPTVLQIPGGVEEYQKAVDFWEEIRPLLAEQHKHSYPSPAVEGICKAYEKQKRFDVATEARGNAMFQQTTRVVPPGEFYVNMVTLRNLILGQGNATNALIPPDGSAREGRGARGF